MYDGTIFVGGTIGSFGSDAIESELTDILSTNSNNFHIVAPGETISIPLIIAS